MANKRLLVYATIIIDLLGFNTAFFISYLIRSSSIWTVDPFPLATYANLLLFMNILLLIVFSIFNLYKPKHNLFDADEFMNLSKGLLITFFIVFATTYLYKVSLVYSRFIFAMMFVFALILITLVRKLTKDAIGILRSKGIDNDRVIIIGDEQGVNRINQKLSTHKEWGYKIQGYIGKKRDLNPDNKDNLTYLGSLSHVENIISSLKPNTIFISKPDIKNDLLMQLVMKFPKVEFKVIPPIIDTLIKVPSYDEFKDIPLIEIPPTENRLYFRTKRVIDIVISIGILLLLSPFLLIIYFILLIEGKPIFKQRRVGLHNREFFLYKFRTMKKGAEKELSQVEKLNQTKVLFKSRKDPRITRFGKVLRRMCIDEIPQLINVIKGDMSLVGPRPHLRKEIEQFEDWQKLRLRTKPGLTGLWQITGRHELDFNRSVALDLYYIKNMSFWLDMQILIKTIPSIVFSRGLW